MRDANDKRETEAMLGNASPRKPKVATFSKSSSDAILLVAWRASANGNLGRVDADAIIANADRSAAAALEFDLDAPRARIQCVFDQFLDHRSGTLDHLAGGDLIDEGIGQ